MSVKDDQNWLSTRIPILVFGKLERLFKTPVLVDKNQIGNLKI